MTGGEGECRCGHDKEGEEAGREEVEEEKKTKPHMQPIQIYPKSARAVAAAGLAAATATAAIAAIPRPPKRNK